MYEQSFFFARLLEKSQFWNWSIIFPYHGILRKKESTTKSGSCTNTQKQNLLFIFYFFFDAKRPLLIIPSDMSVCMSSFPFQSTCLTQTYFYKLNWLIITLSQNFHCQAELLVYYMHKAISGKTAPQTFELILSQYNYKQSIQVSTQITGQPF